MDIFQEVLRAVQAFVTDVRFILGLAALIISAVYAWRYYWCWRIRSEGGKCDRDGFLDVVANGDKQLDLVRWYLYYGINPNRIHENATALVVAVTRQQIATVAQLVSQSWLLFRRRWADPNLADGEGTTPLFAATEAAREDIRAILLAAGAREDETVQALLLRRAVEDDDEDEVDRRIANATSTAAIELAGRDGRNALLIAVERGRLSIIRHLLAANADPNVRNAKKEPALLLACRNGSAAIVDLLLQHGARANEAAPQGETPLIAAAEGGYTAIVESLLRVSDIAVDAEAAHRRTALMAAVLNGYETIARLLREAGAKKGEAEARLILAAERGDLAEVRERLAARADPNAQGAGGRSALLGAASNGRVAVAEHLLTHTPPAHPEQTDAHGRTALMIAAEAGDRPIAALLLRHHADVNARRRDGSTALMAAAARGQSGVVEELLAMKPDIEARRSTDQWTALMIAVDEGQLAVASRLLAAGADPNVESKFHETPLMLAICAGNTAMVELLRKYGATAGEQTGELLVAVRRGSIADVKRLLDVHVPADFADRRGWTPLLAAVSANHGEIAALLVREGKADVNRRTHAGTPLESAVRGGSLSMVKELIGLAAKPDVPGRGGKTPLLLACERHHPKIAGQLLGEGADANAADDAGRTPLFAAMLERNKGTVTLLRKRGATAGAIEAELILAAEKGDDAKVAALLAEHPRVNTPGRRGETALLVACERAQAVTVTRLLAARADPNVQARSGKTPLTAASRRGDLAILEALLARGARIDVTGELDRTALMLAAEAGQLTAVRRLLKAKNNPNDRDRDGWTALILAAANGHDAIVSELIEDDAEVEARGPGGQTALMRAAAGNHTAAMRALLAKTTQIDARDSDGSTALILAALAGQLEAVRMLVAQGADVNVRDTLGNTPLMAAILGEYAAIEQVLRAAGATEGEKDAELIQAAKKGDIVRVRQLIAAGLNVNARRRGDSPPLILAIENGHDDVANELLEHGADVNIKGRDGLTALIGAAARNDPALTLAVIAKKAEQTAEAVDGRGRTASVATTDANIRIHLKAQCNALLPDDAVFVTVQGDHYHVPGCYYTGSAQALQIALSRGLRPCSHCLPNQ